MMHAGTFDNLYVTLIGTERESEHTHLTNFGLDDKTVKDVFSSSSWREIHEFPEKDWFSSKIVVRTPKEDEILFPCHTWLYRGESVLLRGGRAQRELKAQVFNSLWAIINSATKAFEDVHPQLVDQRRKEVVKQKLMFKWEKYVEGIPYILNINDPAAVPAEIRFSFSKARKKLV